MTTLRGFAVLTRWMIVGLIAATVVPFAVLTLAGHRSYTVMSGSMEPAIETGDVVVNRPTSPRDARVGDVVTFKDPSRAGRLVTHRVLRRVNRGDQVAFVTRGDANTTTERWTVPAQGRIGRVVFDVPKAGFVMARLRQPTFLLLVIVLPAVVLAAFEIRAIWRKEPEPISAGVSA